MKKYLLMLLCCPISFLFAQKEIRKTTIDINNFRKHLLKSPKESFIGVQKTRLSDNIISLPFPDGTSRDFQIVEYSILPKELTTDVRTYYGQMVDDISTNCRITMTKNWLAATIYRNGKVIVIEKSKQASNANDYDVFLQNQNEFECNSQNEIKSNGRLRDIDGILNYTNGATLRTYRMALMVTDEFYIARGNTDIAINAEVIAIVNGLNGIFEKEIAVRFTLVSPKNPVSSNVFYRKTESLSSYLKDLDKIRVEMNTRYGAANYDLGQCLHESGGGKAYYGVCDDNYKGGGWSGGASPSSLLLLAHEVGHQFTAPHTFLANGNDCTGSSRNLVTAFEPGSGSTIMSYFGLCGSSQNLTGVDTEPYFHTNSLQNMITYIQTGTGNTCGTATATGNTPPVANAGASYTIPKNTPFTLTGSGNDANGDVLSYTWEEYDLPVANDVGAIGNTNGVGGYAAVNSTTAPLFRSKQSSSPQRTFPSLGFILDNANNPTDEEGEDLPNIARTMNFRLTVRDNRVGGGGTRCSAVAITVDGNSGPFLISSQNSSTLWFVNKTANITWLVNGTNAAPLNCANVKISFSTDGGLTFPTVLAASTPNDGSEIITIPNLTTTQGRIKVEAIGNVFFDINNVNILITNTCLPDVSAISSTSAVTAKVGNTNLNLGLLAIGEIIPTFTGTIDANDPETQMVYSNSGVCATASHPRYEVFSFVVTTSGTYTFTRTSGTLSRYGLNLYNASYVVSNPCANWISSNATCSSSSCASTSVTANLSPGQYYLVVSGLNSTYNGTYTITPSGGTIYSLVPPIDSNYDYTFLVRNHVTDKIIGFSTNTDLTDSSAYPAGNYTVYGFSYQSGYDLSAYIGTSFSAFESLLTSNTICGLLSSNHKTVVILPDCVNSLNLSNFATIEVQQANQTIISTQVINSGVKVTYRAGNSILLSPQIGSGFSAAKGCVFRAEIGGCN